MKIIFARTDSEKPGFCHVIYENLEKKLVPKGITELFLETMKDNPKIPYHMIGRSSFICLDNIVKIRPCNRVLIIAGKSLTSPHVKICGNEQPDDDLLRCSDDLLRQLEDRIK